MPNSELRRQARVSHVSTPNKQSTKDGTGDSEPPTRGNAAMGIPGLWDVRHSELYLPTCYVSSPWFLQLIQHTSETRSLMHLAVVDGFERNESGLRGYRIGIDTRFVIHCLPICAVRTYLYHWPLMSACGSSMHGAAVKARTPVSA